MKKIYLILLLFACFSAYSQDAVRKVTKNYFRSDPFAGEFSVFVKHLLNDPSLKEKEFYPRSDTGLFYLHGFYSTHNPFFFKPQKVEVVLAEIEMEYNDSLPADTVMIYQLVAYSEETEEGIKDVKKEFEKIHKQISKGFSSNNHEEQKTGAGAMAGWYNYFLPAYAVAPVTLAWGLAKEKKGAVLNITVRVKPRYNQATLAAPFLPGL